MKIRRCASLMLVTFGFSLLLISLRATGLSQGGGQKATALADQKRRIKIAQGEYLILEQANGGAVGPFGEEIYDFHETWTLWRTATGGYEVEGERRFQSPKDANHADRFVAELSRDLTLDRVTEFARLKWRRDSGPLTCEFLRNALHCSSNGKNAAQALQVNIPMQHPFGLLWPISAFSLSGLTREAERDPHEVTHIQLVSIEQPSAEIPINPMVLDGELRYIGEEIVDVAGQPRRALKFSFKVVLSPELIIWTSPRGILLKVAVRQEGKDWPEESMKLIHFEEVAGFE